MSRPKDADSAKTMAAIVDATLALMAERSSPTPPGLRSVAKRAGVSLGTIQYYFDSKEELLEACLDGYYERLGALVGELTGIIREAAGARGAIEHALRRFYQYGWRERGLLRLRMAANAERGELHPRRQRDFMGALVKQGAKVLSEHTEVSELDVRFSIQGIVSMTIRFALMSDSEIQHLTDLEPSEARREVEEFVVRAGCRLFWPSDG